MKLDLSREQHETLESALDTIRELTDYYNEQKDELLYQTRGSRKLYLEEQLTEMSVIMHKLTQARLAIEELS